MNTLSDHLKEQGSQSWMPAGVVCIGSLSDDLHLPATVLIVLGFVLVVPQMIAFADWCTAHMQQKKYATAGADPTPLLS